MLSRLTSWWRSQRKAQAEAGLFERDVHVTVTETDISVNFPTGDSQAIAWTNVNRILVETNDSGPWGADVWWVLEGDGLRCSFPLGATGQDTALAEIRRRYPSFEVKGMNSVDNATFICWEKGHAL
jgi:hypothetical protein